MALKKNKSKVEEETVANMSTGWRKSKMSESLVQELENMGLLQSQGVIQWHADEGEDYPMEGTLETVMFRDFVERGLALPLSEFFTTNAPDPSLGTINLCFGAIHTIWVHLRPFGCHM